MTNASIIMSRSPDELVIGIMIIISMVRLSLVVVIHACMYACVYACMITGMHSCVHV